MSQTPRVLHVVQSGDRGGVQRHVRDVATGLRPLTAGVVTGTGGWLAEELAAAGIPAVRAPALRRALDPLAVAAAGREVRQAARNLGANTVHAHGIFALLAAQRVPGLPLVYTAHGFLWHDPAHPAWLRHLARRIHRGLAPRLAALVAVSAQDARDAAALGIPPERIHRIANGVALEAGEPLQGPPPRVIGTAGRLVPGKGVEDVLRLTALLPADVALHVAGTGPAEAGLKRRAEGLGLGARVRWLGWVDDMGGFYRGLGVYATLSRKEGLPYAVLDAMAHGVPVVASAIPAHAEILDGATWGVLIADGNLARAVEGVGAWLGDPAAWAEASAAARGDAADRFGLEAMLERLAGMYRQGT